MSLSKSEMSGDSIMHGNGLDESKIRRRIACGSQRNWSGSCICELIGSKATNYDKDFSAFRFN